jgi:hypothetical protein
MKKYLILLLSITLFSCKGKRVDLSGEVPVKVNDFIAAFPLLQLPYIASDTNINKLSTDSIEIGRKAFIQFVPDTALNKIIGKNKEVTITPVGRIEKQKEDYLLATFNTNKKTSLAVFVFNKEHKFLAYQYLLSDKNNDEYSHFVSINKEPTFLINREKLNADKQLQFTRVGWVYVSGANFMVVINDGNEDTKKNETIINPIDTLPRKNKLSGDYVQNKKNFISIRDSKKTNYYFFFIHFEKKEENCTGELKGELKMKDATHAIYSEGGDPCVIDFYFEGNEVVVKEKGSCGNRRGMNCFFDDTYIKKKETKTQKKK